MSGDGFAVALFPSAQAAVRAELAVLAEGIAVKLVPVPRELSAECGLAMRFRRAERERVEEVLGRAGIAHRGIWEL